MGYQDPPPSYDDMVCAFDEALEQALSGGVPRPVSQMYEVEVTQALLDVMHAARENRPTGDLVIGARQAFAAYAADYGIAGDNRTARPAS